MWTSTQAWLSFLVAAVLSSCSFCQEESVWQDSFRADFNYNLQDDDRGPNAWDSVPLDDPLHWQLFADLLPEGTYASNQCGRRQRPSPIPLQTQGTCRHTHEMLTRQIRNTDCKRDDLVFDITPYSLRAYYPINTDGCELPEVYADGVDEISALVYMEVHTRAEHVVDGRRYDGELQMVHAVEDSNQLLIVSLLLDASDAKTNLEFQWLLDQWQQVANRENDDCLQISTRNLLRRGAQQWKQTASKRQQQHHVDSFHRREQQSPCTTDPIGGGCDPLGPRRKMYPYSLWPTIWYYGYQGSLSAPPCTSNVQWRILDRPMTISRHQYRQLTSLMTKSVDRNCQPDTAVSPQGENFRPLQQAGNNQDVYHCTYDDYAYWVYPPEAQ